MVLITLGVVSVDPPIQQYLTPNACLTAFNQGKIHLALSRDEKSGTHHCARSNSYATITQNIMTYLLTHIWSLFEKNESC